jgi:hypoxanthine phosphoribosyltransferase
LSFTFLSGINILSIAMELLISEEKIQQRVSALAKQISKDFRGREVLLIGVLKGSIIFMADLSRKLKTPVKMDFVRLASYGSGTRSSGEVQLTLNLETSLRDKDVLVVEDIIDTGITLQYLLRRLKARRPKSLRVVALLDKPGRRQVELKVDYIGFRIEDRFVVGYGLDYAEQFRNLPGIYAIESIEGGSSR